MEREEFIMYQSVDVIWTLLGAAMVFFMQAGFALCETGMTRAKNTGNIIMKNLMDFCIGTPIYWHYVCRHRSYHRRIRSSDPRSL